MVISYFSWPQVRISAGIAFVGSNELSAEVRSSSINDQTAMSCICNVFAVVADCQGVPIRQRLGRWIILNLTLLYWYFIRWKNNVEITIASHLFPSEFLSSYKEAGCLFILPIHMTSEAKIQLNDIEACTSRAYSKH